MARVEELTTTHAGGRGVAGRSELLSGLCTKVVVKGKRQCLRSGSRDENRDMVRLAEIIITYPRRNRQSSWCEEIDDLPVDAHGIHSACEAGTVRTV